MSTYILGIGTGSLILGFIWIITFILCFVAIRTKKVLGIIALIIASIISLILIVIPKHNKSSSVFDEEESDYLFVWHNIFAFLSGLCAIGSIVVFCSEHAVQPVHPSYVKSWIVE